MNAIQEGFQEVYQLAWPVEAGGRTHTPASAW